MRLLGRGNRPGFTMLEAVLALAVVSMVLVSALHLTGAATSGRLLQKDRQRGQLLARELMSEVFQAHYADPDGAPRFGLEPDESGFDRIDWDDLDDYNGWVSSPPRTRAGWSLDDLEGWSRSVTIEKMQWTTVTHTAAELMVLTPAPPGAEDSGVRRIVVTVASPHGHVTTLSAIRADHAELDARPTLDWEYVPNIAIDLQVGADLSGRSRGGTAVLNHRASFSAAGGS